MLHKKGIQDNPQRTCLACRTCKDKNQLLRFILSPENEILPDLESKLPGRGAYTCINKICLAATIDRQQFKRAFKHDVLIMEKEQFIEHLRKLLHSKIIGLIGLANKAGVIVAGGSMVSDALKGKNRPAFVIVAGDVSAGVSDKIINSVKSHNVDYRIILTKNDFGAILGKAPKSAIGIASGGFVAQLVKAIDKYKNFLGEV